MPGRFHRRLRRLAQLRRLPPDGSGAADRLGPLLDAEVEKKAKRQARKLGGGVLAAIVLVSLVGGGDFVWIGDLGSGDLGS